MGRKYITQTLGKSFLCSNCTLAAQGCGPFNFVVTPLKLHQKTKV